MIAIIKTGGKQYKVQPKDKIKIEKINAKEGEEITFDQVLLTGDDKAIKIGEPVIAGAKVVAKVLKQGRAPKITGVKYKNKTRHRRYFGHQQPITLVEIKSV